MGISRSATVICAYLIAEWGMRPSDALKHAAARRAIVCPNPGFRRQLDVFHARLHSARRKLYKAWRPPFLPRPVPALAHAHAHARVHAHAHAGRREYLPVQTPVLPVPIPVRSARSQGSARSAGGSAVERWVQQQARAPLTASPLVARRGSLG